MFYKIALIIMIVVFGYTVYTNVLVHTAKPSAFKDYSYLLGQREQNNENCHDLQYAERMFQCESGDYSYYKSPDKRIISVYFQYQGNNRVGDLIASWGDPLKADYFLGAVTLYWQNKKVIIFYNHENGDRFSPNNHIKWIIYQEEPIIGQADWRGFKNN